VLSDGEETVDEYAEPRRTGSTNAQGKRHRVAREFSDGIEGIVKLQQGASGTPKGVSGTSTDSKKARKGNSKVNAAPRVAPSKRAQGDYLRAREAAVKSCVFDLSKMPRGRFTTARTVKAMSAWGGLWPALREFMQNTIDHLGLAGADGLLHPALTLEHTGLAPNDATLVFRCGEVDVCVIRIREDQLVIDQAFTFALHPRALETGVLDSTKGGAATAGGFGDGFKTACIALLAQPALSASVEWEFEAPNGQLLNWRFVAAARPAVGSFRASKVLEVVVEDGASAAESRIGRTREASGSRDAVGSPLLRAPSMRQTICAARVGEAFVRCVMPRLMVFWSLAHGRSLLSTECGGCMLADASAQPVVPLAERQPEPGVYVKGIYVRKPFIDGLLMTFDGRSKLEVSGRDRNNVDAEECAEATMRMLKRCAQPDLLRELCKPLAGSADTAASKSWLLRSPRFLNPLLEEHADFFKFNVLGMPRDALFASRRTTQSKRPFLVWATAFLASRGAPLQPLDPNASRALFKEVAEEDLERLCVQKLLAEEKGLEGDAADRAATVRQLLRCGCAAAARMRVHFHAAVRVAFVHGTHVFVPATLPFDRALLVRLLGTVQRAVGSYSDKLTHLQQAIFEVVSAESEVSPALVRKVVQRAEGVAREASAFERVSAAQPVPKDKGVGSTRTRSANDDSDPIDVDAASSPEVAASVRARRDGGESSAAAAQTDAASGSSAGAATSSNGDGGGSRSGGWGRGGGDGGEGGGGVISRGELEQQIRRISASAGDKRILPSSAFAAEESGREECLRPHSALTRVAVHAAIGGGDLFADAQSLPFLDGSRPDATRARKLKNVREAVKTAKEAIETAVPSLGRVLRTVVKEGFDAACTGYLGWCTNEMILINLAPLLPRSSSSSDALVHELVTTILHEIAHLLCGGGSHGPAWRDKYDALIVQVLACVKKLEVCSRCSTA